MTGVNKKNEMRAVGPVHRGNTETNVLPNVSECMSTRDRINAFLDCFNDVQIECAYKAIKRIFFYR